ncbi:MAG TPA: hypothetical protein VE978_13380 [Chitinophagales bacterium]|nr:hypothetical protein [Chitinophagales bacterium]
MLKFSFFLILFGFEQCFIMAQSSSEVRSYRSLDLIVVDNSQPDGNGMELSERQFLQLQSLVDEIHDKQPPSETLFVFYVCNRSKLSDVTDIKSRLKYVNDLQDSRNDLPANFTVDRNAILNKILKNMDEFSIIDKINIYYFFPPKFFEQNNFANKVDAAKFINYLSSELSALTDENIKVNVEFYIPFYLDNITSESVKATLESLGNFQNSNDKFKNVNLDVQIAN